MLCVQLDIRYPGLSSAEQERLASELRQALVRATYAAAATVRRDDGSFLLSTKLDVDGDVRVGEPA